jgi:hypothetical protein
MSAWATPALMNGNPASASAAKNLRIFQHFPSGQRYEVSLADVFANLQGNSSIAFAGRRLFATHDTGVVASQQPQQSATSVTSATPSPGLLRLLRLLRFT